MIRGPDARDEGTATEDDECKLAALRAEKRALRYELVKLTTDSESSRGFFCAKIHKNIA